MPNTPKEKNSNAPATKVAKLQTKAPPSPVPLCRFEELAMRENRLRDAAMRQKASSE